MSGSAVHAGKWATYPAYKPSGVVWLGHVPEHWDVDRAKWTVTDCRNGIWGEEPDGINDLPCVRVADFNRSTFRVCIDDPTMRAVTPKERRGRLLQSGDLLLEKSGGGDLQPVGAVMQYDHDVEAVCANFIARMPVANGYASRFLAYLHAHLNAGRVNTRSIKQTTGIQNLDSQQYLNEVVVHPPLDEQRAIAAFLDRETARIDALIERKRRQIELLQEKRTALISHAVTKGLDPNAPMKDSGIEWLGQIPEHWEVKPLGYMVKVIGGCTPSKGNDVYWGGTVPWVTPKDMKREVIVDSIDHITDLALTETGIQLISPPAVLTVVRGMILAHTFPVALTDAPVTVNQDMKALVPTSDVSPQFLACLLRATAAAFYAIVEESGHGTKVLRTDLWTKVKLPVPPRVEQKAILAEVSRETSHIDAIVAKVNHSIAMLREHRAALISAAVTGKIDVRDAGESARGEVT